MLILLYGLDTYRSRLKLREIVDEYKKAGKLGLNLKHFFGKDLKFIDLRDELRQTSIFKEKKLIILTDASSNTDFKKEFIKQGRVFADSENIIIFYESNKLKKNDALLTFLSKNGKVQEFNILSGIKLKDWTKRQLHRLAAKIDDKALDKLTLYVGSDLWQMANEVNKLANYKNGQEIRPEDVELLVRAKVESNIFETIDAIASKDKKRAIQLLKEHLQEGDAPFYLFSMINFQFRNMLIVKDLLEKGLSPFSATGLHPFVIKKSSNLCRRFELLELKKIYLRLSEIDFDIKIGKIEPETAIDLLVSEI